VWSTNKNISKINLFHLNNDGLLHNRTTESIMLIFTQSQTTLCLRCPQSVIEMITIRFAGWIYGRIVSLQPDTDIQKLLSNGNRIRIRISETFYRHFESSDFWKKLHIAQSFFHYLQKHLFSLLCHDTESIYGVISVP